MAIPSPSWLTDDDAVRQNRDALIVPLEKLIPAPWNARQNYPTDTLRDLGVSLKNEGVIHPLLVRPYGPNYQIVAGHRRYLAALREDMTELPVIVRRGISDAQAQIISFAENLQRESVAPANVLAVLSELEHQEGGRKALSRLLKRDETWVSYQLTALQDAVSGPLLLDGEISFKQAIEIARSESPALKERLSEMARKGAGGDTLRAARFAVEPPDRELPASFGKPSTPPGGPSDMPMARPVAEAVAPLALVPAPGSAVGAVVDELRRLVERLVPLLAGATAEERAEVARLAALVGEAARAE